jgi:nucleoside-diphosphate-sugar epimerase
VGVLAREGGALQLAVINPVGVLGPILGTDYSTSIELVQSLMNGALPGVPQLSFGLVDVRDVADIHLRAMTHPDASGERFLAIAGDFVSMQEIARTLKLRMGETAARVPTRVLPNWMVRLAARVIPSLAPMITELGKKKHATNEKARRVLEWHPRSSEEAIVAIAESLARFGLLKR